MQNSDPDAAPAFSLSTASADRGQWVWLDAIGRSLDCGILLVDLENKPALSAGAPAATDALRSLLVRSESGLISAMSKDFKADRLCRLSAGDLRIVCRRLHAQETPVGAVLIALHVPASIEALPRNTHDLEAIETWLTPAIEAQLGRRALDDVADDAEDAFDRLSSLHRLLHDGVESSNEHDVVTAFAEALFAWDGIEAIGYVEDVQGLWMRAMSPPGSSLPVVLDADLGPLLRRKSETRLNADEVARLGFASERHVVALQINHTTPEPWILLFAEGYRPLNAPRLNLYADLLREALVRVSGLVETRATWAILQTLLGATDPVDRAVDTALREFSRVIDGLAVSLIVTNTTGTTLLTAGDRETVTPVRPFDRGNRLVATVHLPDLGTMQLAVRRARGRNFSRREQHLVERAAAIFSAWLPGAVKKPVDTPAEARATHDFEEVLDRAAAQIARDGLDVSLLVIAVPENDSRISMLQHWVTEIRARLRGSDLAGAISDREIGVLLSGTSQANVPVVSARLGRSLGLEENNQAADMGSASRGAGSDDNRSIVKVARKNIQDRRRKSSGKRTLQ